MKKPRILNLPLELTNLTSSKRYGYSMGIGLDDAFHALGAEVVTIPVFSLWPPDQPPSYWLRHLRELIAGQTFDQVWIEIQYSNFDDALLEFLTTVAPVRVALMTESRVLFPGEYGNFFDNLPVVFKKRLPYLTHVLFPDEKDVDSLKDAAGPRGVFLPLFVNSQFIDASPRPPAHDRVTFLGRLLRDREALLGHPAVAGMVELVTATGEEEDYRLRHFDSICRFFDKASQQPPKDAAAIEDLRGGLAANLEALRCLKDRSHRIMMKALTQGIANLNLRSYSALFSSRVVETMAAGQCVISYRVPDRPRTNGLFEHGKEILLFDDTSAESLAEQVNFLRSDRTRRQAIIAASQKKVLAYHTTERRVEQLLHWIETGDQPRYG